MLPSMLALMQTYKEEWWHNVQHNFTIFHLQHLASMCKHCQSLDNATPKIPPPEVDSGHQICGDAGMMLISTSTSTSMPTPHVGTFTTAQADYCLKLFS